MRFITKLYLIAACLLTYTQTAIIAQTTARHKKGWDVNLLSVSSQKNDSIRNNHFVLGLFANKDMLSGVQMDLGWNLVHGKADGLQIGGLLNMDNGDFSGVQIAGFGNLNAGKMRGVQISGLTNMVRKRVEGAQISIFGNLAGKVYGVQCSSLTNIASNNLHGVQLAGVTNITVRADGALQLSLLTNVCQSYFKGAQIATYNAAGTLNGTQIGLINICRDCKSGVQVGLINYSSDSTRFHKIGLVNVNPTTRIQMMSYGGNTSKINLAVRFYNRKTYKILGVGTHYLGMDDKFSGCLFYRTGLHHRLTDKLELSGDLGYYHIETFENENINTPERMYSLQGRINLEYRVLKKLSLFGSGGYALTRYYDKNKFYERKAIIEAGIIAF